MIDTTF